MKTSEIEKKLGISKHTILYYEKEGLLHPARDENEYRNYSDKDFQVLQLIKLLRSMEVSIDDIKLIISGQLNIQDCLKTQEVYLQQSIDTLKETKQVVKTLKEKEVPIIPALSDIETVEVPYSLGYRKTTKTVTLGRKLTKAFLIRNLCTFVIAGIAIGGACYYGLHQTVGTMMLPVSIVIGFVIIVLECLALAGGFGLMKTVSIEDNPMNFIEFSHDEIHYYQKGAISKQVKYFIAILKGQDTCTKVAYDQITKVKITHVLRYMKIPGTNLSTQMHTKDYVFYFTNGEQYNLLSPIVLEDDQKYIDAILQEKVENIQIIDEK